MQHRQETYLGPKKLGVPGYSLKRFGCSPEKDVVDDLRILLCQLGHPRRHGKDHVEIRHRQEVRDLLFNPFGFGEGLAFGTVPIPTGVVGVPLASTAVATFHMSPQVSGAAHLEGLKSACLRLGQKMWVVQKVAA
jgi:hypothetical protein